MASGCMKGLGRVSFFGLRVLVAATWVFVVICSQTGVLSTCALMPSSSSASRSFFSDFVAFSEVEVLMCLRRAFEAFSTWTGC